MATHISKAAKKMVGFINGDEDGVIRFNVEINPVVRKEHSEVNITKVKAISHLLGHEF